MLAKEVSEPFDSEDWIFEVKWDGYRAVAEINEGAVKIYSRNGNDFSQRYLRLVDNLRSIKHNVILDGEIVVLNEKGFPDFQKMQHYEENTAFPLIYYVFDLLFLNGKSTVELPLLERKKLLKEVVPVMEMVRHSEHVAEKGISFFEASTDQDLEGMMAKKADSLYYPGKRTTDWLKVKNHKTAEVVIAGFTKPTGSRAYFGSLVLGMWKEDKLVHIGQAGTGFDGKALEQLFKIMKSQTIKDTPFEKKIKSSTPVTWIKPSLICEVKFTEWTSDEKLRHPVFIQLRNDKNIKSADMQQQKPVPIPAKKTAAILKKTALKKTGKADNYIVTDKKNSVPISNPDKVYFPDDNITKKMVVEYYQSVAEYILPFLKDRPESLKRNPNGINDIGFFHKDAGENAPAFIKSFQVHSESSNKEIDYIICNDKSTLAYLNNLGCIELNPWHSTMQNPGMPDYMIIDIDPSDENTFEQVIEAAKMFKKILDKAGANSFCKTSGASGLHIYVPMKKKYTYEEVKNFAQLLCMIVSERLPEFTTLERNLKKRGNSKMYLDYLQNRSGQTIASVYSLRPKKGATVSMPLDWKEVKKGLVPASFNIHNSLQRIKKNPGMFLGIFGPATNIARCIRMLNAQNVGE